MCIWRGDGESYRERKEMAQQDVNKETTLMKQDDEVQASAARFVNNSALLNCQTLTKG